MATHSQGRESQDEGKEENVLPLTDDLGQAQIEGRRTLRRVCLRRQSQILLLT